jgi:hypothetical protein
MSRFEQAAERARAVLPSAVADIVADVFLNAESHGRPNPSTLQAMDEILAMPVLEEFVVDADYYRKLIHEPCGDPVLYLDGGDTVTGLIWHAGHHVCKESPR